MESRVVKELLTTQTKVIVLRKVMFTQEVPITSCIQLTLLNNDDTLAKNGSHMMPGYMTEQQVITSYQEQKCWD